MFGSPTLQGRKNFPSTILGSIAGSMIYTDNRQINRRKGIQIYSLLILHANEDHSGGKMEIPPKSGGIGSLYTVLLEEREGRYRPLRGESK